MEEYPLWRIWSKKGTPIDELRNKWTYVDVMKALAIMDQEDDWECAVEGIQARDREN